MTSQRNAIQIDLARATALARCPPPTGTCGLRPSRQPVGPRTPPPTLTWALSGSLVFADEAAKDGPTLDSFLGEVGGCPRDALLAAEPHGDVRAVLQKLGAVAE